MQFVIHTQFRQVEHSNIFFVIYATIVGGVICFGWLCGQLPVSGDIATGPGIFDLDNFRTQLGEKHTDRRAREHTCQLNYFEPFEKLLLFQMKYIL